MKIKPLVSVIITTYNEERFIRNAIASAANQSMDPSFYEIIVVDDGGTDNTEAILNDFKSEQKIPFKYLKKKNGGTASARNFGVANARAEVVSFLDGDDTYLPNKLQSSYEAIRDNDNIGIVYSDYVEKYPDKALVRLKQNFNPETLFSHCIISTNSMVRKAAIDRVGGFDETFRYVEDYDLWCRIVLSGYFALRVPEILFIYNSHPNSKTNSTNLTKIQPEWDKISERVKKHDWLIKR
jgi:glycosyltransferase involved in cell wall biosynthesis